MPKRRKDCFLGIHFDFHAMSGETVAHHFDPDVFREMLDRVNPDFLQFDTKGHPGLSSYPTKVGTQAKRIEHDVLRFLREETRERDIAQFDRGYRYGYSRLRARIFFRGTGHHSQG